VAQPSGDEEEESSGPRIALIVNKKNQIPPLAVKELEGIFLLERRYWLGTARITVVVRRPGTELHRIFARRLLPNDADEVDALYTQRKASVRFVDSDDEAIAAVAEDPGAIAYVWAQAVKPTVRLITALELENPEEGVAPARTARMMGTLRGVWDQLLMALRNPKMPVEDLELIAEAVAEESAQVRSLVPRGRDRSTLEFARMASQLQTGTAALPRLVSNRKEAIRRMETLERTLCIECHRNFRQ
jgi:hypothetical protein